MRILTFLSRYSRNSSRSFRDALKPPPIATKGIINHDHDSWWSFFFTFVDPGKRDFESLPFLPFPCPSLFSLFPPDHHHYPSHHSHHHHIDCPKLLIRGRVILNPSLLLYLSLYAGWTTSSSVSNPDKPFNREILNSYFEVSFVMLMMMTMIMMA